MLHVGNGPSAATAIRRVVPNDDEVLEFPFPLNCGPIRALAAPTTWLDTLDAYWSAIHETHHHGAPDGQRVLDAAANGECLTLWLGTTAADHLLAALLFDTIRASHLPAANLRIAPLEPRGSMASMAAGVAGQDELEDGLKRAYAGDAQQSEAYTRAWRAWTSSEPTSLSVLASESSLPPALAQVMRELLLRYPDASSGLGRWDFRSLHHVAENGPNVVRVVGHLLVDTFDCADLVGGGWVYSRMRRLAAQSLQHPLLAFDQDSPSMRGRTVELTEHGRAVMNGETSFLKLNGLADEIGGVSFDYPNTPVWVRSGTAVALREQV